MRDRGFGRVTDQHGKPWVGATVHLLHRPHASIAAPAFGEQIVRTTDDRGQFKAPLLVGSAYVAWAVGPVEKDRSYRITKQVRNAVARSPILLVETDRQFERRVQPRLHASWNAHAALRWRASLEGSGRVGLGQWLTPDADGIVTLPQWPSKFIMLQGWAGSWLACRPGLTTTEDYALRFGFIFRSKEQKPNEANVLEQFAKILTYDVDPRRERDIALTAVADGKKVTGAALLLDSMPFDLEPHCSDQDGIVHAVFAHEEEVVREVPFRWTILPSSHAELSLGLVSHSSGDPAITAVALPAGRALSGRLLRSGEPVPGVPLMIEASVPSSDNGSWFSAEPRITKTQADGSFTILGRRQKYPFRVTAALSPTMREELSRREPLWPVSPLAVLHWGSAELPKDFGDVDLSTLKRMDVAVTQPDGSPPGSIKLLLTRVAIGSDAPHEPVAVFTDHRGRVRVLAPNSEDILVHATTRQGAAWQRLERQAGPVHLKIDARHIVKLRVVNGRGEPLTGASVGIVTTYAGSAAKPGDEEVRRTAHHMCMVNAFPHKSCRVNKDGYGELISPLLGVRLDLNIRGKDINERRNVQWNGPTDEPLVIVIDK